MSNWYPTPCGNCGRLFVNRPRHTVIGMLASCALIAIFVLLTVRFDLNYWVTGTLMSASVLLALGISTSPVPFEDLEMYTKRPWWQYPLIYFVIPLVLVVLGLAAAIVLNPI